MKYYLCVSLDDEHYTNLTVCVMKTEEQAAEWCRHEISILSDDDGGGSMTVQQEDGLWMSGYIEDRFIVAKALPFECESGEYIFLFYHAYDGVDFHIFGKGSLVECEERMNQCVEKRAKGSKEVTVSSTTEVEIDTGLEWEEYRIYPVDELMSDKSVSFGK